MDSYSWIMYAGMATWAGIGLYLCFLARRQALLSRRLGRMAQMMEQGSVRDSQPASRAAHPGHEGKDA